MPPPSRLPAIFCAKTEPANNLEKDAGVHCSLVETAFPIPNNHGLVIEMFHCLFIVFEWKSHYYPCHPVTHWFD